MDDLLSSEQAASALGVTKATPFSYISRGCCDRSQALSSTDVSATLGPMSSFSKPKRLVCATHLGLQAKPYASDCRCSKQRSPSFVMASFSIPIKSQRSMHYTNSSLVQNIGQSRYCDVQYDVYAICTPFLNHP